MIEKISISKGLKLCQRGDLGKTPRPGVTASSQLCRVELVANHQSISEDLSPGIRLIFPLTSKAGHAFGMRDTGYVTMAIALRVFGGQLLMPR